MNAGSQMIGGFSSDADRLGAAPAGAFGIYQGWHNVLIGMVAIMLTSGATAYSFGLFIKPVSEELDISRANMNLGLVMFHIGMAVYSPIVGRLLDRWSILSLFRAGAALFGLGFIGLGWASSPILFAVLILGPIALGTACAGALFVNVMISRWFTRLRGRALTVAAMGTSLGGLVVFPIVAFLVAETGWRSALIYMGVAFWVLLGVLSLLLRPNPASWPQAAAGPATDGVSATEVNADAQRLTPSQILRMPMFWCIAGAVCLLLGVDQALLATITPYVQDKGFTVAQTASIMSATTGSALAGKFLIAWIADRVDLRLLLALTAMCTISMCAAMLVAPSYLALMLVSGLTGLAVGGTFPLGNAMIARAFGATSVGAALGLMSPVLAASSIGCLYFIGLMYDWNGSYDIALSGFIGMAVVSILLMPLIQSSAIRPRQSGSKGATGQPV